MWAINRVGIGLSHWPARLFSLAELIPWNRGIDSLESILGILKNLKIWALLYNLKVVPIADLKNIPVIYLYERRNHNRHGPDKK
jgi:hypothetical protein